MAKRDALQKKIADRTERDPDSPRLMEAAARRRELLETLVHKRKERCLSKAELAARMRTSRSSLARLVQSGGDGRLPMINRMAVALGLAIEYRLVDAARAKAARPPHPG